MANGRRGVARGAPHRKGALPWDQDPVIMARLDIGARVWAECRSVRECQEAISAWLRRRFPEADEATCRVSIATLYDDRHRIAELAARRIVSRRQEHLVALDHQIAEGWRGYYASAGSVRVGFYNGIMRARALKAAIDGSLRQHVEASGRVEHLREIIEAEIPDPEQRRKLALRVLPAVAKAV